jgi:cobalt/nickel transport system permease protein
MAVLLTPEQCNQREELAMHLGNGAITPECAVLGFAAAAVGVGYSGLVASRKRQRPEQLTKAFVLGGFVFAAQMLNIPILASSSAHFVGGVLLAELLGPAVGVLTMSCVLLLQALLLGDGGIAALGVNIVNMALVPAGASLLVRRWTTNQSLAMAGASTLAICLAVLLIAGEVAIGRSSSQLNQWTTFIAAMAGNHLPLLGLEGLLTVVLVGLWQRMEARQTTWRLSGAAALAAVALLAAAITLSSALPDGYESAAAMANMNWLLH